MLKHIIFYSSNQFAKANCNRYKLFIAVQFIELIKEKKHLALATSWMMLKHLLFLILSQLTWRSHPFGKSQLQ